VAKPPDWYVRFCLDEARQGNPHPLIGRLNFLRHSGGPLSAGEFRFITEALEKTATKRAADNLREVEKMRIGEHVEDCLRSGMPLKVAVEEVMRQYDCSRRHVFAALKAYKGKSEG
jgi:hypothetical protein